MYFRTAFVHVTRDLKAWNANFLLILVPIRNAIIEDDALPPANVNVDEVGAAMHVKNENA